MKGRCGSGAWDGVAGSTAKARSRGVIGRCEIVTTGRRTDRHPRLARPIGATKGGAAVAVRLRRQIAPVEAIAVVEAREAEVGEWVVEVGAAEGAGVAAIRAEVAGIQVVAVEGIRVAAVAGAEGIAGHNTTS